MKRMMLLMVALLFAGAQTLSAQRTITGTVISADDNMTVPGASVSVRGTTIGTMTDINGRFSLNVPADATHLVFSFMGMETQEIEIGGSVVIDARLTSGAIGLEEFVVVGFGTARRVGNMVGSVQQVGSAQLEARPVANVMDALQGQVAGLQVFQSSGEPGTIPSMRLHGISSLGASSTPLFIVDGIQVEPVTFMALNANDFESVTVLRDASATAIFGARAANGVVVATTRRGLRNEDARVQVRTQWGVSQLADRRLANSIMSTNELYDFWLRTGMITQDQIDANDERFGGRHNTRWYDYFMRDNVPTFQTDVNIRGGGGRTTYFISGNHFSQQGTAHGSYFERFAGRINLESQAKDWLTVGMNTHLSRDFRRNANNDFGGAQLWGGLSMLLEPWISPYDEYGNRLDVIEGLGVLAGRVWNPEYEARHNRQRQTNSQMTGNFFIEIAPMEGLRLITRAGANAFDWTSIAGRLPSHLVAPGAGTKSILAQQRIIMTINNVIQYSFSLNNAHNFTALVGQEGIQSNERINQTQVLGIPDDRLWEMGMGEGTRTGSSTTNSFAFLSFFGRVDYNFNERFFGEVTVRNDRSSRFGVDNRSAWFWAVGGMWRMTNEPFIRDIALITDARLNISYGTQGNSEIGNFTHLATAASRVAQRDMYDGSASWMVTAPGNRGLTWETQDKLTVGLHTELAHRYSVSVEFYTRRTSNMLYAVPFPFTSGFPTVTSNIGVLRNTGIDVTLGMDFVRTRDFHLGGNLVFNYNRDMVVELFQGHDHWILPETGVGFIVGQPIMFVYPIFGGVDPGNGRQWWYLPGEDIGVTQRDPRRTTQVYNRLALEQSTGMRRYAPVNGGFGINAGWRGLNLNADFVVVLGNWMWDNTSIFTKNPVRFPGINQHRDVADFWEQPGDIARFPDWRQGQGIWPDTRFLSNASFMRLRNLTLSYNFPSNLLARTNFFSNARVFATGRNLFTVTNFIGIDPEVDSNLATGTYGNSRQFQVGIDLTF